MKSKKQPADPNAPKKARRAPDPELKAMGRVLRAIQRCTEGLNLDQRQRVLRYMVDRAEFESREAAREPVGDRI